MFLLALSLLLGSCSSELSTDGGISTADRSVILRLDIQKEDISRGVITSSNFEEGDSVYVLLSYITYYPIPDDYQTFAVYSGGEWKMHEEYKIPEDVEVVVNVYYPYSACYRKGQFTVGIKDPLSQTDILYGVSQRLSINNPVANIQCSHVETRLTFPLKNNSDSPIDITKMSITTEGEQLFLGRFGYIEGGYFYVSGEYTQDYSMDCNINIPPGETANLDFLLPPTEQACEEMHERMINEGISKTILKFSLDAGDRTIKFDLDAESWKPGKQYIYPVNISEPKKPELSGEIAGHEYIDLGLSVLWASCNVGAATPYESGLYFQWATNTGYSADSDYWQNQKDEYPFGDWTLNMFLEENIVKEDGGNYNLTKNSDVANRSWKDGWRTPTVEEFRELIRNCTFQWDATNLGMVVRSNINGEEIFMPAAGRFFNGKNTSLGVNGEYWMSTYNPDSQPSPDPYSFYFVRNQTVGNIGGTVPSVGMSIRPVIEKQ